MKNLETFRVYDAPDVNLKRTGKILKRLRQKNNLTVRDLQDFFGFDYPNAIYDWEKGLKLPNTSNLIALATLYEIPIDDILLAPEQDFAFYGGFILLFNLTPNLGILVHLKALQVKQTKTSSFHYWSVGSSIYS